MLSCSHIIMCSYASFPVQVWIQFVSTGLNSILFAINIDNTDLNGQVRGGSSVSDLLKESTQGMSSLWKESTQGVSTLLREIGTATAVVPGFIPRSDAPSDPLPVLPRSTSAGTCHIPLQKSTWTVRNMCKHCTFRSITCHCGSNPWRDNFVTSLRLKGAYLYCRVVICTPKALIYSQQNIFSFSA